MAARRLTHRSPMLVPLTAGAIAMLCQPTGARQPDQPAPAGMALIPAGEFTMGSDHALSRPDERPMHRVRIHAFWIDVTEVTNAQFAEFVAQTGYVTLAERPVDWESLRAQLPPGTPRPPDTDLQPGSLVFTPPDRPVDLDRYDLWWTWTPGACWKHPEGPSSLIEGRENHPVVHVAHEDALAYAAWAGKSLPTEAQWEYAARGGLDAQPFTWGSEPLDPTRCNIWTGQFPHLNTKDDGYDRTAPAASFPPNAYGLYDMAGNVWEWCADLYHADAYALASRDNQTPADARPPFSPQACHDPRNPDATDVRVQRGGSFLCSDEYCASYRPSARMGCTPDTSMSHVGFRCVKNTNGPDNAPSP